MINDTVHVLHIIIGYNWLLVTVSTVLPSTEFCRKLMACNHLAICLFCLPVYWDVHYSGQDGMQVANCRQWDGLPENVTLLSFVACFVNCSPQANGYLPCTFCVTVCTLLRPVLASACKHVQTHCCVAAASLLHLAAIAHEPGLTIPYAAVCEQIWHLRLVCGYQ